MFVRGRRFLLRAALFAVLLFGLGTAPRQAEAATKIKGIDVSQWQGSVDWTKVKKAGVEFVMLGTGRYKNGSSTPDPKFETNIKGAINAGVDVGVYYYSTVTTVADARNAADYVLDLVDGYKITYPIAIDMEDSCYNSMTTKKRTSIAIAFMKVIKQAGYYPMIYANTYWTSSLLDMSRLSSYDIWVAAWQSSKPSVSGLTMWQYSSTGKVSGISTAVDLDYSYRDYTKIVTPRTRATSRRSSSSKGWNTDGKNYWYVQSDGSIAKDCWLTVSGEKYYVNSKGYRLTGWQKISKKTYYFNSKGVLQTGWLTLDGKTYYLKPSNGVRRTGFQTIDGKTYYFKKGSGVMQKGLQTISGKKYYFNKKTGVMKTGWKKINGEYYYFRKKTGAMKTGWLTVGGNRYYMNKKTGIRTTGWLTKKGEKYYFGKKDGIMVTGWKKISKKWYYFSPEGVMQKNTTVGNYKLGPDGVCTNR